MCIVFFFLFICFFQNLIGFFASLLPLSQTKQHFSDTDFHLDKEKTKMPQKSSFTAIFDPLYSNYCQK